MKKTLIALAVLAASGASFAQVTITGNLTMGYQAKTDGGINGNGAVDSAGLGVDTSEIDFAATEDLGGGWKAIAKLALAGADRSGESGNGTATGRDASLSLVTTGGVITLASVQAPDYLSGTIAGVGSYYAGWDKKVFSARSNRDVISYSLPIGAFTLATSYQETANVQGLGQGTTGDPAQTGQSLVTLGATYAQGPVAANFTYLSFNSNVGGTKDQTRLSGSYDLGVAKLGLGAVVTNGNVPVGNNPKMTDLELGVSAPLGAVTLGASFVSRKYDDFGANSGTATGAALQASYALSKRTSVIGNYARWTQTTAAGIAPGRDASTQYQMLVSHSF